MIQEGYVEGAFQTKSQNKITAKNKKNKRNNDKQPRGFGNNKNNQSNNTQVFPLTLNVKKTNHPQKKCWWRPDARCHKPD